MSRVRIAPMVVGSPRRPTVEHITLHQVDEPVVPPEGPCIRLAIVDDVLFLTVLTLTESGKAVTETDQQTLVFDVDTFGDAISLLIRERDRNTSREPVPR
jgi:hypothetical protein